MALLNPRGPTRDRSRRPYHLAEGDFDDNENYDDGAQYYNSRMDTALRRRAYEPSHFASIVRAFGHAGEQYGQDEQQPLASRILGSPQFAQVFEQLRAHMLERLAPSEALRLAVPFGPRTRCRALDAFWQGPSGDFASLSRRWRRRTRSGSGGPDLCPPPADDWALELPDPNERLMRHVEWSFFHLRAALPCMYDSSGRAFVACPAPSGNRQAGDDRDGSPPEMRRRIMLTLALLEHRVAKWRAARTEDFYRVYELPTPPPPLQRHHREERQLTPPRRRRSDTEIPIALAVDTGMGTESGRRGGAERQGFAMELAIRSRRPQPEEQPGEQQGWASGGPETERSPRLQQALPPSASRPSLARSASAGSGNGSVTTMRRHAAADPNAPMFLPAPRTPPARNTGTAPATAGPSHTRPPPEEEEEGWEELPSSPTPRIRSRASTLSSLTAGSSLQSHSPRTPPQQQYQRQPGPPPQRDPARTPPKTSRSASYSGSPRVLDPIYEHRSWDHR